ncbi:MAG TPA: hypothetical protein VGC76_11845 [Pyrinomonadaceae bacterium]|jgi:hypothetical protein
MIKIDEKKLDRLQKISKIIGFVSFGAFIVLFLIGFFALSAINQRIESANANLNNIKTELENKNTELGNKQQSIDAQEAKIKENEKKLHEQDKTLTEALKVLPKKEADKILDKNPDTANSLPRIYLHIGEEAQRPLAETLQKKLQAAGYIIPGIQNVAGRAVVPTVTQLRYCVGRGQDSDIRVITDLLAKQGIKLTVHDPLTVPGCANVSSPRSYELWLPNDSDSAVK